MYTAYLIATKTNSLDAFFNKVLDDGTIRPKSPKYALGEVRRLANIKKDLLFEEEKDGDYCKVNGVFDESKFHAQWCNRDKKFSVKGAKEKMFRVFMRYHLRDLGIKSVHPDGWNDGNEDDSDNDEEEEGADQ